MTDDVKPKRRYESKRRLEQAQETRRAILAAAQRRFEEHGYAAIDRRGDRRRRRRRDEDRLPRLRVEGRRPARALEPAPARRAGRPAGRRAGLVPRGARGARPGTAASPERAQLGAREAAHLVDPRGDPQRRLRRPGDRRALAAHPVRLPREPARDRRAARDGARRSPPASTSSAPPTSSGRSTIRTRGSCSSCSAAGRLSSTSSGLATPPAGSCSASGSLQVLSVSRKDADVATDRSLMSPAQIREASLPKGLRGFDEAATRKFLSDVADTVQTLMDQLDKLQRSLDETNGAGTRRPGGSDRDWQRLARGAACRRGARLARTRDRGPDHRRGPGSERASTGGDAAFGSRGRAEARGAPRGVRAGARPASGRA